MSKEIFKVKNGIDTKRISGTEGTIETRYNAVGPSYHYEQPNRVYMAGFIPTSTGNAKAEGLRFSEDGTKMYIAYRSTDSDYANNAGVLQIALKVPFDHTSYGDTHLDGGTFPSVTNGAEVVHFTPDFSAYSTTDNCNDLAFSKDGKRLYVYNSAGSALVQAELSTAWDLSTATQAASYSLEEANTDIGTATSARGFDISPEEDILVAVGFSNDKFYEFKMSTPGDITTMFHTGKVSISVPNVNTGNYSNKMRFSPDGKQIYLLEYDTADYGRLLNLFLPRPYDISSYMNFVPAGGQFLGPTSVYATFGFGFTPDCSKIFSIDENGGITGYDNVGQHDLEYDVYALSYTSLEKLELDVSSGNHFTYDARKYTGASKEIMFKNIPKGDTAIGFTLDIIGSNVTYANGIGGPNWNEDHPFPVEYTNSSMRTGEVTDFSTTRGPAGYWNYGSATPLNASWAFVVYNNGTKAIISDNQGGLREVDIDSTQFDASTPSGVTGSVFQTSRTIYDLKFSPDGNYLFKSDGYSIVRYPLSSPFNISGLLNSDFDKAEDFNSDYGGLDPFLQSFKFDPTGTRLFLANQDGILRQYHLREPWNPKTFITTSHANTFAQYEEKDISAILAGGDLRMIEISPDGSNLLVLAGAYIHQIKLNQPWNLASIDTINRNRRITVSQWESAPLHFCIDPDNPSELYFGGTGVSQTAFGQDDSIVKLKLGFEQSPMKFYWSDSVIWDTPDIIYPFDVGYPDDPGASDTYIKPSKISSPADNTRNHYGFIAIPQKEDKTFDFEFINNASTYWKLTSDTQDRERTITSAAVAEEDQNPTIVIYEGDRITFTNTATSAHPMIISSTPNSADTLGWIGSVQNQEAYEDSLIWVTRVGDAGEYFYMCTNHSGMMGKIIILENREKVYGKKILEGISV